MEESLQNNAVARLDRLFDVEKIQLRFEFDRLKPVGRIRRSAATVNGQRNGHPRNVEQMEAEFTRQIPNIGSGADKR